MQRPGCMPTKLVAVLATVAALISLMLSSGSARAEKRVALLIGNGLYENVARLANPIKDASTLADVFRKAGFDSVALKTNVSKLEFNRALRQFMDAAQDADIAVLYYAGHGIQVRDMNYMIPVDAKLATEIDAEDEAVSLDRIAMALEPAKRLRLIILDACRDNPFERTMKRRVAVRAVGGGLARMEPIFADTLIAYAAKAGSIAEDGGGENSPFATALVKHLMEPGLDIRVAFGRVRDEVLRRTAKRQEPFVYGSLGGDSISLVAAPTQAKPEIVGDPKTDYELAERVGTQEAWEAFLANYKGGLYADLARAQLGKLKVANTSARSLAGRESPQLSGIDPAALAEPSNEPAVSTKPSNEPAASTKPSNQNRKAGRLRDEPPKVQATSGDVHERKAARKPEEPLRVAKPVEQDRGPQDENCLRDGEKLDRLRGSLSLGWAREDLKRLQGGTTCDRVRADADALLTELAAPAGMQQRASLAQPLTSTALQPPQARPGPKPADGAGKPDAKVDQAAPSTVAREQRAQDEACSRDDDKLARLRGSLALGWAREDLKRLQAGTACDHVRAEAVALLAELTPGEAGQYQLANQPRAASTELVLSAQRELQRLGCFEGEEDGRPSESTMAAIRRYLSVRGPSRGDINITESLIAELRAESTRVCPLTCARGEHAEGDRCVAGAKLD
jgi:hypothetical protein